jgi:hypothetical protein
MKKIIIYGHKFGSHTHSAIQLGFYRAFTYLGYETFWFDDNDDLSTFDLSDCIFLTEGQVMSKMPIRKDCIYFLHNCRPIEGAGKKINFQYYQKDCEKMEHISHGIAVQDDCVYFSWGANMLPDQFDEIDITSKRNKSIYYIGTVHPKGEKGNYEYLNDFATAAFYKGYTTYFGGGYSGKYENKYFNYLAGWISEESQEIMLKTCWASPAVQGQNQLVNGMIPCRLFKAISYGLDGLTTNPFAYKFFNNEVVYADNGMDLFEEAERRQNEIERKRYLFNFVKEHHTYLNNINALMQMI